MKIGLYILLNHLYNIDIFYFVLIILRDITKIGLEYTEHYIWNLFWYIVNKYLTSLFINLLHTNLCRIPPIILVRKKLIRCNPAYCLYIIILSKLKVLIIYIYISTNKNWSHQFIVVLLAIFTDIYLILGICQMDPQEGFNNKINVLKRKNHTIPSKKVGWKSTHHNIWQRTNIKHII